MQFLGKPENNRKKINNPKSLAPTATANTKHSPDASQINIKSQLISSGFVITYIISSLQQKITEQSWPDSDMTKILELSGREFEKAVIDILRTLIERIVI